MTTYASQWICCQLGARQHYAVPRSLLRVGLLHRLITDAWISPASPLRHIPAWSELKRIKERFNPELQHAQVDHFNAACLRFETLHRLASTSEWNRIMARNKWYGRMVVRRLRRLARQSQLSDPPTIFVYSYAGLEILRYAKAQGWKTVIEQIDPGPVEANIVRMECIRHFRLQTTWESPPSLYWSDWREECELADSIIANSPWTARGLIEAGIPEQKIRIIPLGFDSLREPPQPKMYPARFTMERPLRVLFLGQINLRKGVAHLLEAMVRLRKEPIEFWMVGPNQITGLATAGARLREFPPTSRAGTASYYRTADVFILPTLSDGFALTQLEALAERMPIIVSKNCGEVVRDGVDGILLQEPTADAITEALRECLRDPQMLADFSKEAHVRSQFSLDTVGANLAEVPGL
jgi:glycosyltransferase involved in cell wall biosynthesis